MYTKLFERLVTKFSIKVTDLIKYLEISKATIYNYRNLEKFSDIPKDKQLKIFYLFGKESEQELELVLDEADPDILTGYLSRISSILKGSYNNKLQSLSSIEELTEQVERLTKENDSLKHQVLELDRFQGINDFTRSVLLDKVAAIVEGSSAAEIKEFIDYFVFSKMQTTPRIGFWLDNSNQTPQQTVETILNVRKPV